jgi:hypothetical protein
MSLLERQTLTTVGISSIRREVRVGGRVSSAKPVLRWSGQAQAVAGGVGAQVGMMPNWLRRAWVRVRVRAGARAGAGARARGRGRGRGRGRECGGEPPLGAIERGVRGTAGLRLTALTFRRAV